MNNLDFEEALYWIKRGLVAYLILNGKERRYYLNQFGDIMCVPNGKEHLAYKVKQFQIDAVMSENWALCE